jgi:DNA adenine methylase
MLYLGSKARIAKHILPIMLSQRKKDQWWVEPFVGGCNMIDKVLGNRIGSDINPYLIAMFKALQTGWIPPTDISKDLYYLLKENHQGYPAELVGFVGFVCSFGGKWFNGFAYNEAGRNYTRRGRNYLLKQKNYLIDVVFSCGDYTKLNIPENSLIYCDPPYQETTEYKGFGGFNYDIFWLWCRYQIKKGHIVFISSYKAPEDFKCVKQIETITTCNKNTKKKRVEKLFWKGK